MSPPVPAVFVILGFTALFAASGAPALEGLEEALAPLLEVEAEPPEEDWRHFIRGWELLSSPGLVATRILGFALAGLLGAALAYHPRMRAPRMDPDHWEGPKAILVYSFAGFFAAKIVIYNPAFAFVIFGIGPLLRFRSNLGSAKNTGRAIIAVLVGLACGLDMIALALVGTAVFWGVMYLLEARSAVRIEVRKLPPETSEDAVRAWSHALEARGCAVKEVRSGGRKGRFDLLVLAPTETDVETLVRTIDAELPFEANVGWVTE